MPSIKVLNQNGAEVSTLELDESVFGAEYREALTEVRGGGIKPWRQKGTGRARQGSIRSPQWTGGGVVFAPKPRDFSQKVNKVAKRNALVSALSAKLADGNMIVVDKIALENAKTKEMVAVMNALNVDKRALLVVTGEDAAVVRAAKNIPTVTTMASELINVYDLVANEKLVVTLPRSMSS